MGMFIHSHTHTPSHSMSFGSWAAIKINIGPYARLSKKPDNMVK